MPTFIVKPDRDEDFYVAWSTVVDSPTAFGSRANITRIGHAHATPERLARADEYGTSMCDPDLPRDRQWFGWRDDEFIVMEVEIADRRQGGAYFVPRANVRALCVRMGEDELADVSDLLVFHPDEDDS
jgi:hypothetical protein